MATRAEMETTVRWDEEEQVAWLCTAYKPQADRWAKAGYAVRVLGQTAEGEPRTWEARVPKRAITFRRLVNGRLPVKPAAPHKSWFKSPRPASVPENSEKNAISDGGVP